MSKLDQFTQGGDSKSLTKIDGKAFTITRIDDSDYRNGDEDPVPGVKITTKESFEIDGEKCNRFHTTRVAIVNLLSAGGGPRKVVNEDKDPLGPVKCASQTSGSGRKFFNLVNA